MLQLSSLTYLPNDLVLTHFPLTKSPRNSTEWRKYREKGKKMARNWRMRRKIRPMGEIRKSTTYLLGDITAGPLYHVYNMQTCAWSPRKKAHKYLKWIKSMPSVCFKEESWWRWDTRQLVAEKRHDPGGKGICWSRSSANFFSLCGLGQFI